ncbi:histidine kinase dimerization/phospho-acceptor domain-containing protein, partial [Planomonospora corallina]
MALRRTAAFAGLYAAAVLVGRMDLIGGTGMGLVWPAAIGEHTLLRPDGTPMGGQQMPHMLALAGHEVRGMDVLVCPSDGREERLLSVSATRLPACDQAVVVIFYDVTAERRHRDELMAFAGVVAHDLVSPLTTVDSWTQLLAEAVEPDSEIADGVTRIRRAAGRMRETIQDLLAHATARDAAITPEPTGLGP